MNRKRIFFWRKKVDVQDVFNRVIDAKFYSELECWMCSSLIEASGRGLISRRECRQAVGDIGAYLTFRHSFLRWALDANGLPSDFKSRLAIYRDWTNRPSLK